MPRPDHPPTIVSRPEDPIPGSFKVRILVRGEDTAGVLSAIEETIPPGAFITPHTHANDVWVQVITGEVGVLVGDEISMARAGEWALKPRNILHAMWNAGSEPSRIIEVLTPAGSERWFEELAAVTPGDHEGFNESCRRHDIDFVDSPWTEEIRRRFGL